MSEIRFIDLFSGIGGFRLGLQRSSDKYRCVWSNDWDTNKEGKKTGFYANQIYTKHFGSESHNTNNIERVSESEIPSHDLICGGFPCQPFSVAGKRQGFKDTRGTPFFEICRIAKHHRPSMLLLENVKGLLSHDGGRTFGIILESLEELGYWWEYQVLNSKYFGVPQTRERVFIIGHLRGRGTQPIFPITTTSGEPNGRVPSEQVASALQPPGHAAGNYRGMNMIVADRSRHLANKGRNLESPKPIANSITAVPKDNLLLEPYIKNIPHGYNDGFEKELPNLKANRGAQYNELVVIPQIKREKYGDSQQDRVYYTEGETPSVPACRTDDKLKIFEGKRIRRLTPLECERLQAIPDRWTEGISETQRYKCLGNAVTVNVIEYLGGLIQSSFSKSLRIDE